MFSSRKVTSFIFACLILLSAPFAFAEDRLVLGSVGAAGVLTHSSENGFREGGQIEAGLSTDTLGKFAYDLDVDGSLGWLRDRVMGAVQFGQHTYVSDIFGFELTHQVDIDYTDTRANLIGLGLRIKDPIGSISLFIDAANFHYDRTLQASAGIDQGLRLATRHFLTNELSLDAGAEAAFVSGLIRDPVTRNTWEGGHWVAKQIAPGLIQEGRGHYVAGNVKITFRTEEFYISAEGKIKASVYAVIEQNSDGTTGETKEISTVEKEALLSAGFAF